MERREERVDIWTERKMDEWIEGLEGGRAQLLNGWVGSWLAGWNPGRKT